MQGPDQTTRSHWPVTATLLLAVIALAVTNVLSMQMLSAVRSYVSGESLWSKGQKDAGFSILRYSETQDPADFARFEKAMAIPLGDRIARQALDAAVPDRVAAGRGFVQGGNHPSDVGGMVDLFLRFRHVGFMARAIAIWEVADVELDRFLSIATQVRDAVRARSQGPAFEALRERMRTSNDRLTIVEQRFSDSLGEASRSAQRIVAMFTVGLATLLAVGGGLLARTAFQRVARVERSLCASNDRWTVAARAAKAELFDWDLATDVVTVHLGSGVQTTQYADFLGTLTEDDRSQLSEALAGAKATRSFFSSDQRLRGSDGGEEWRNFLGQFLYDTQGKPYRMIGMRVDVTDRKRAQAALFQSEERYRTLWETAPDAVVVLDETGRIEYANASTARAFGWEQNTLVGVNIEQLQPVRLRSAHRAGVARYLLTGEHSIDWRATEAVGLHRDGHEFALEVSFSHSVVDGKHVFAGFLRDIDARKRTEADRARLADFVEKSLNEIYVFSADTMRVEYVNAAGRTNLRRSMPELREMTPADFSPSLGMGTFRALLHPLLDGSAKQVTYETEHLRADGSRYPAQVTVQFVGRTENRVLLATAWDVTERVAADAARKVLLEQLRQSQKMESLGTLAGGIAHDFNNIVGAILGNVALARHDLQGSVPARESIDQINKAALRARELVGQILTFSRQQAPRFVDQAFQPIILETLQLLRASLPAGVKFEFDMPDEPLFVRADSTQIEQVLMNLCTNAWHAAKTGDAQIFRLCSR